MGTVISGQVDFQAQDLPGGSQYVITFTLDGLPHTTQPLTWGAGVSGTTFWTARLGDWLVTPGSHTLTAVVDAFHQVQNTNETHAFTSFQFTPVTFQSVYNNETHFVTPLAGDPYQDWSIVNYVDLDSSPSVRDYRGGDYTYNGHGGIDYTLANFAAMDVGVPVYAAASGVVVQAHDGEFDRNTAASSAPANVVTIDHGNGWQTQYYHLRKNSVAVAVGDLVQAGQVLGLVGSSGSSSDAHLHFQVNHQGMAVETYVAPDSYWANPLPYSGDMAGALDFGVTDHNPTGREMKERPTEPAVFPATPGQQVLFWARLHGIHAGDSLSIVWSKPDGTTYYSHTDTQGELRYTWYQQGIELPSAPQLGYWTVAVKRGDVILGQSSFLVANNPAALGGIIQFNTNNWPSYFITENSGSATITVTRKYGTGAASVDYTTFDLSARAGIDYTQISGTMTFSPGEVVKTFTIPILDDSPHNSPKTLLLGLSNPTGGATPGLRSFALVNIIDSDNASLLNFDPNAGLLTVKGDTQQGNDKVTLDVQGANVSVDVNGQTTLFPVNLVSSIVVRSASGNTTINVQAVPASAVVTILGGSLVNVGKAGSVQGIQGAVIVRNLSGTTQLTVDDSADTLAKQPTLGSGVLKMLAPAPILWDATASGTGGVTSLDVYGGSNNNTYTVTDTSAFAGFTTLHTGTGADAVNVQGTTGRLRIDGSGGSNTVMLGSNAPGVGSTVARIKGTVSVFNPSGATQLIVDDSGDIKPQSLTLDADTNARLGALTQLAAPIFWTPTAAANGGVTSLAIYGGSGGNTVTVNNTSLFYMDTFLNSGNGNDIVNVKGTTGTLFLDGNNGRDQVNVGNAGSVAGIQGFVGVYNAHGATQLSVDDRNDPAQKSPTFYGSGSAGFLEHLGAFGPGNRTPSGQGAPPVAGGDGFLDKLAQGQIYWHSTASGTGGVTSLDVYGGSNNNTYTVTDTSAFAGFTTLHTGTGADAVSVQGTTGRLAIDGNGGSNTVTVGSNPSGQGGTLSNVHGSISVGNALGHTALLVDDSGDGTAASWTVNSGTLTAPGTAINYVAGQVSALIVNGGSGRNAFSVQGTAAGVATTLNTGSGNNTVTVGSAAHTLYALLGVLTVHGQGGTNALAVDDSVSAGPETYTVTNSSVRRADLPSTIHYSGMTSLVLSGGSAGNTINVASNAAGTATTVNAGTGNNTINVGNAANSLDGIVGPLTINGHGHAALTVNDQGAASAHGYLFTANTLARSSAATITYSGMTSLVVNMANGSSQFEVLSLPGGTAVAVKGGSNTALIGLLPTANTWRLTALNAGTLDGTLTFSSVANLEGGNVSDTFVFSNGAGVSGVLRSGNELNHNITLDYSAYTTPVAVNLTTFTATGVGGGIDNVQKVIGGSGTNLLVGGPGRDTLVGGSGRSVLIGGAGDATLVAGSSEAVLIGGATAFDRDVNALNHVMAEWARTDATYQQRVDHLINGGGLNGLFRLNAGTVHAGGHDTLTSGPGLDLLFLSALDQLINPLRPGERLVNV